MILKGNERPTNFEVDSVLSNNLVQQMFFYSIGDIYNKNTILTNWYNR